jgi:ribosome biogenesis protein Nip4
LQTQEANVRKMKVIKDFVVQFGASITLDKSLVVKKRNRYFLFNKKLKKQIQQNFYYAGLYLGKLRGSRFFPSFPLLTMMANGRANKTVVDKKTGWLFICGRDIFKKGVLQLKGRERKGEYTLILNEHNECLGFGKILANIRKEKDTTKVVVKNILDIGDFLRREKR